MLGDLMNKKNPQLRFPEFSGEWKEKKLGKILKDTLGGGTPSRRIPSYWNGTIPWASVKDFDNKYKINTLEYITEEGLEKSSSKLIPPENLIISTRMGLGKGFINKKPIAINQDLKGLIPNKNINVEFLYYWYKGKREYIETLGKGSTVKGIRLEELHSLPISVPLTAEQQKIASFLSKVDEKIEKLCKKKQLWQTYKKVITQQLFSQELRFKDENGFVYPDWEEKTLKDLLSFKNGLNAPKGKYGKGTKFINVSDILNNDFIIYNNIRDSVEVTEEQFNIFQVNYGDVLFQRSSETREEVGTSNVYLDKEKRCVFGGFVIRGKKIGKYDPLFLKELLKTHYVRKEITSRSGGSTRYNIGQESLKIVKIKLPSISEQTKISIFLSIIAQKIKNICKEIKINKEFKKGLLQQLFPQDKESRDIKTKDLSKLNNKQAEQTALL